MNVVQKLKNPSLILAWLRRPEGEEFIAAIGEVGLEYNRRLRKENDEKELFRLQGKLEVISSLVDLIKEIKQSQERGIPNAILEQKRPPAGTS